ncbi:MAG: hypothetical protein H5U24_16615 [Thioclava marina]|jgi:hypothetical protein|uniref:hypothetical protein n=1 Tax=Thioclava marina TaxID=1915077 RepID=UPI0019C02CC0|nr:hypothetical protein [Thioclava marina]MBC7147001.1 hypothetical protein [Thioclava marina]
MTDGERKAGGKDPNLSRWFWGAIIALLALALILNLLFAWQVHRHTAAPDEAKATLAERAFAEAGANASAEVRKEIDPLLDEAYAPVYAGIPAYLDYHYSLTGEWLELGNGAIGKITSGLDDYMFKGLDARLEKLSTALGHDFNEKYSATLDQALGDHPRGSAGGNPVLRKEIDAAKRRMEKTVVIVAGGPLAGASLKALSKVFAEKLIMKLAVKLPLKAGTKWATAASGAGAGAAICSWTGPGAGICAAIGGVIAFVAVDKAMVELDEYISRDKFESELRVQVDQQKAAIRQALVDMLDSKEKAGDSAGKIAVRNISLSELKDADKLLACRTAEDILTRYEPIRETPLARSPAKVQSLRSALKAQTRNHLLAPWVEEMENALDDADLRLWVRGQVSLAVEFPPELQENHKIEAGLTIGQKELKFDWKKQNSTGYFVLYSRPEGEVPLEGSLPIVVTVVQDRGLFHGNRSFSGATEFNASAFLDEEAGTSMAKITIPMTSVEEEAKAEDPMPSVTLRLTLAGEPLPEMALPEFCAN